ncbi:AraC family transcriptional regulator [Anaerocolumna sp. AGMB13025]|uniref:helix-turn-helix domain-containing protein n=1 Tax=Anaerocolumna sp. AGMB13025 TaxID=3039116 RepID=UPI00241BFE9D|nr:AraC family transcriptional regulator [Anaerocolumna sp. AGMB13025]WFR56511.1 AraC family transcriptional regulator [Anaerocolumna sp. AGMB13025]
MGTAEGKPLNVSIIQFGLKPVKEAESMVFYELEDKDGYGKMLVCRLFPGIYIYYNDYNTTHVFSGKFSLNSYFQLSYSYEGTYEFELKDNRCIYIGERELIAFHNIFESLGSKFPQKIYKGFALTFDIEAVTGEMKKYFSDFSIEFEQIITKLCEDNNVFVMKGNPQIQDILEKIYFSNPFEKTSYIKIKVLELLHLLSNEDISEMKYRCSYYDKNTVLKVRKAKEQLVEDLTKHHTIEVLAKEHHITKTLLKACFKDMYGLPPYEYLKKTRMNQAALYMKHGKYSICEIGGLVGYQNASKFSGAFKDVLGITPSEYLRRN